jgi:hypothetical protein
VASGSSYTGTPAVAINDPTGTGATATAVVVGNVVTSINVTAKGQGYTNPSVVISGGGGSGATATAKLGSDDALLGIINRASAVICEAVNRPKIFDSGVNITEKRNGNGQDRMTVAVDPIISVSSLTIDGATVPASDGQSAGYLFDNTTIYLIGYVFTRWVQNVVLIYRGGCVANSGRQLQLEAACLATVALWWKRRAHRSDLAGHVEQRRNANVHDEGSSGRGVDDHQSDQTRGAARMTREERQDTLFLVILGLLAVLGVVRFL